MGGDWSILRTTPEKSGKKQAILGMFLGGTSSGWGGFKRAVFGAFNDFQTVVVGE